MKTSQEILEMSLEERLEKSRIMDFGDGYLGSSCYGVDYYYEFNNCNNIEIRSKNNMKSIVLSEENFDEDDSDKNWDELFNYWFKDGPDFEIIDDGYGRIIIDKEKKLIEIVVVPCIYNDSEEETKYDDALIYKFNNDGNLIRNISEEDLIEILKNKNLRIG